MERGDRLGRRRQDRCELAILLVVFQRLFERTEQLIAPDALSGSTPDSALSTEERLLVGITVPSVTNKRARLGSTVQKPVRVQEFRQLGFSRFGTAGVQDSEVGLNN